jgi:hypothetical protein
LGFEKILVLGPAFMLIVGFFFVSAIVILFNLHITDIFGGVVYEVLVSKQLESMKKSMIYQKCKSLKL